MKGLPASERDGGNFDLRVGAGGEFQSGERLSCCLEEMEELQLGDWCVFLASSRTVQGGHLEEGAVGDSKGKTRGCHQAGRRSG